MQRHASEVSLEQGHAHSGSDSLFSFATEAAAEAIGIAVNALGRGGSTPPDLILEFMASHSHSDAAPLARGLCPATHNILSL